jgi:hypothetical protein
VYCPLTLDNEIGEYHFRNTLPPGYFCRSLAEHPSEVEVILRSSVFVPPEDGVLLGGVDGAGNQVEEVRGKVITAPAGQRSAFITELTATTALTAVQKSISSSGTDPSNPVNPSSLIITLPRTHAVCTVQTFRNSQSGPMLYLFAAYYLLMGWSVVIFDRFGLHFEYLTSLRQHPGFYYHPYTIFQLAQPSKYNSVYASTLKFDLKYYYKMERNWGYSGKGQADTADQDQDKTRTYDYARVEYSHMESMLYVDADEFFFCPQSQASGSISSQRKYQQRLMNEFSSLGVEEMRFVRIPYSGIAPPELMQNYTQSQKISKATGPADTADAAYVRAETDFTNSTLHCMLDAYHQNNRNVLQMFQCWSSATAFDNFPKSSDFAGSKTTLCFITHRSSYGK